ncbi:MAG: hypothetical protein WBW74_20505 [Xanthobacteraceae bacterium]
MALALGAGAAFAQDDDEEVPLDTKLFRQLMKDLGLRKDGEEIDYRERAPLVVPPSLNLPPPQDGSPVAANPAWPKDPDVVQRKAETVRKKQPARTAADAMEAEGRPLSRAELDRGKTTAKAGGSESPEEAGRAMLPAELHSKSFFKDMFSSFSNEAEVGKFDGEPVRDSLTAPPAGYQTPSPEQPYGLRTTGQKSKAKAATVEDRAVGYDR